MISWSSAGTPARLLLPALVLSGCVMYGGFELVTPPLRPPPREFALDSETVLTVIPKLTLSPSPSRSESIRIIIESKGTVRIDSVRMMLAGRGKSTEVVPVFGADSILVRRFDKPAGRVREWSVGAFSALSESDRTIVPGNYGFIGLTYRVGVPLESLPIELSLTIEVIGAGGNGPLDVAGTCRLDRITSVGFSSFGH